MNRYQDITVLSITDTGKPYYKTTLYPHKYPCL
jgi:hypothetical protein